MQALDKYLFKRAQIHHFIIPGHLCTLCNNLFLHNLFSVALRRTVCVRERARACVFLRLRMHYDVYTHTSSRAHANNDTIIHAHTHPHTHTHSTITHIYTRAHSHEQTRPYTSPSGLFAYTSACIRRTPPIISVIHQSVLVHKIF